MTPRIAPATEAAKPAPAIFAMLERALGTVPNLHRTLAHAPEVLEAYTHFAGQLAKGRLDPKLRESIAVAVAGANGCDYCAAAHATLGQQAGLERDELQRNLAGESSDERVSAALRFVRTVLAECGAIDDATLDAVRTAGFDDGEIVELIAHTGLNTFTNLFNNVARTEVDFPRFDSCSTCS